MSYAVRLVSWTRCSAARSSWLHAMLIGGTSASTAWDIPTTRCAGSAGSSQAPRHTVSMVNARP